MRSMFRRCFLDFRDQILENEKNNQYNEFDKKTEVIIMRQVITRAMIECDLLSILSRHIPLPLKALFLAEIRMCHTHLRFIINKFYIYVFTNRASEHIKRS